MARVAMIGATGLIGGDLANRLVADGHQLITIGRRDANIEGADNRVVDPAGWSGALAGETIDVAISTLGTTRKAAGSMEAFEAVDRHAVAAFARAARGAGARQWMMVSSVGADPESRVPYLAVKGRAESDILHLAFERTDIFRPGLLVGDRADHRAGEAIAIFLSPLLNPVLRGRLSRYRAIQATSVAAAMAGAAGTGSKGVVVHFNDDMLAEGAPTTGG